MTFMYSQTHISKVGIEWCHRRNTNSEMKDTGWVPVPVS